jgi:PAS domain S-box-containing protein
VRIVNGEGELLYTNQAFLDLCGYGSIEELKAVSRRQLYTPESYAEHEKRKAMRKRGEPVPPSYEMSIVRRDGGIRHLNVLRKEIIWNGQKQFQVLYQDITDHKRAEAQSREGDTLREVDRLRTQLLANISHELRTPLASIKGFASVLLSYDKKLKREEKREYLETIDKSADRLTELIQQLLDMSRLDAGTMPIEKKSTGLGKLLRDAVAEAQVRSPTHRFSLELARRLPKADIDARRIRQVLDNLISNAVNYSHAETEVTVAARRVNSEILVSVADQGIGIPAGDLPHVFDRLFRAHQRRLQGKDGVGLGLSICRALVEAHGGRIWIESEEGKGTKCFFTLPIQTSKSAGNAPPSREPPETDLSGLA